MPERMPLLIAHQRKMDIFKPTPTPFPPFLLFYLFFTPHNYSIIIINAVLPCALRLKMMACELPWLKSCQNRV